MKNTDTKLSFIVLTACISALGGFLFGFDSGVINGTFHGLQSAFGADSLNAGFNVASMLLGSAVGALVAGRAADRFGRRSILYIAAVLFLISAWGSGIANASVEFVAYRILGGLAVGAASIITPAYISEIAPAKHRGALASLQQIAITFGLFGALSSNYILAKHSGSASSELWFGFEAWRWMFWMEVVPAILFLLGLCFIPESPRYLVMTGQNKKATRSLTRLFGAVNAQTLLVEIRESLVKNHKGGFFDLLEPGTRRLRLIVWSGLGLAAFQQFVGINVVFYYGAVLWQTVGFEENDALLINVITGGVSLVAIGITLSLVDKLGRRPFLLLGSVGMGISLSLVAFAFSNGAVGEEGALALTKGNAAIALVGVNLFVFMFNLSWGPIMWVLLGEMFPNHIRGSALAICGFVQWVANFIVTLSFPILLTSLGLVFSYSVYALFALVSAGFVKKFIVETRGKTLEQM